MTTPSPPKIMKGTYLLELQVGGIVAIFVPD
jgi:hypothetical protein